MANDDGIIRIGTSVDVSSLRSGMEQAASAVQSSTQTMASAMEEARVASQRLAEAQTQFGAAAAAGSEQAASVLQMYRTELASAQSAVQALAGSETEETAVLQQSVSARMAASSELRVLEGNMMGSTRAAGAFLSMLPGIGSAMQVAFPVFGAVALVEILGRAVAAVGELVKAFKNLDGAENLAAEDAIIAGDKIIKASAARFSIENFARVSEGAPANKDIDLPQASARLKEIQYARELADAQAAVNEQGKTGLALQQQKIADAQKDIEYSRQAKEQAEALVKSYRDMLAAKITVTHEMDTAQGITIQKTDVAAITDPKQVEAIQAQTRTAEQAVEQFTHQIEMDKVKLEGTKLKIPELDDKAFKASMEAHLAAQQKASEMIDEASKSEEAARDKVGAVAGKAIPQWTTGGQTQLVQQSPVQQSILSAVSSTDAKGQQQLVALSEILNRASEATKHLETETKSSNDALDQTEEAYAKLGDAQIEAYDIGQKNADAMAQAVLHAREVAHAVSAHAAAEQQAALHAREYAEAMAALNAQLEVYQQAGKAPEAAQTQNQMAQLQGGAMIQATGDQAAIQQTVVQPWLNAFQQINQGWLQVQNQMLFTTRNIGLDFAKMGQNLVIWGLDSAEKWALQWIEKELLMKLFHQTTSAQWLATEQAKNLSAGLSTQQLYLTQTIGAQTAATATETANAAATVSTQTANATAAASTQSTAVQQATAHAGVAAAGAASSQASIPWIGPALAIAAGAAMFAEVLSMAHLDTGTGYVPSDGLAMLHQGEIVIPAPTASELRNGGGDGGDVHIHQHNNWNSMTDREFKRQLDRHAAHVAGAVKKHLRQAGK
jgi:hypothetical protein